ncbi:MAG: molybdopterin-dependent oxidoreductase, partial [Candidatus Desulforudis sp.]|nr:molybdopterin-dependent oxidoreductase [Desulforudis sp.]
PFRSERQRQGLGRLWEMQEADSVCTHCSAACTLRVSLKDGRLTRVRAASVEDYICARGRFGWSYLNSSERITSPMVKKDGTLVPVGWDEALEAITDGLRGAVDKNGAGAVGGILGAIVNGEVASGFTRLIREGLQGRYVDSVLRGVDRRFMKDFAGLGDGAAYAGLDEVAGADVLLVVGDVTERVPALWPRIKAARERGATLIALDMRESRISRAAQVWLRPGAGAEAAVLEQLAAGLLDQGMYDREALADGSGLLAALQEAQSETGVSAEALEAAVAAYGDSSRKAVAVFAVDGADPAVGKAVLRLAFLTGRLAGGIFPAAGVPNLGGLLRAGAYAADGDDDQLRALYVLAEDPISTFASSAQVKARLEGLEFLVVQDLFLTETAALADVVLPASAPLETGGSFLNINGSAPELAAVVAATVPPEINTIKTLMERFGVAADGQAQNNESGGAAGTPESILAPVAAAAVQPDAEYPLVMVPYASSGRVYLAKRSEMAGLDAVDQDGKCLCMAPDDAKALGIDSAGGEVVVRTAAASVAVKATPDASLPAGVVVLPAYSIEANTLLAKGQVAVPVAVTIEAGTKGGNA